MLSGSGSSLCLVSFSFRRFITTLLFMFEPFFRYWGLGDGGVGWGSEEVWGWGEGYRG